MEIESWVQWWGGQQRVDADGNWLRQTDRKIQNKAIERDTRGCGCSKPAAGRASDLVWVRKGGNVLQVFCDLHRPDAAVEHAIGHAYSLTGTNIIAN